MQTRQILSTLLAVCLFLATQLLAGELKYLSTPTPDATSLLPPPPTAGSAESQAYLDLTHRIHTTATAAQIAQATDENTLTVFHFSTVIGPWFQPGKLPKTEALFKEADRATRTIYIAAKNHWKRLRPYHLAPERFTQAIEHEDKTNYSYPSGHATRGTVYALILTELFPAKRDALSEKGREAGWLRVQGGVHYPDDVFAGRVLGQALAQAFLQNPSFQHDLAEAKAELATAKP